MDAEICMYGNREIGFGCLVAVGGELIKDDHCNGEPKSHRSLTDCLFLGVDSIQQRGAHVKTVIVYAPGGERCARFDLGDLVPYYGSLKWEPAPVWSLAL